MAASDHLNSVQFHGTAHKFAPGDEITAGHESNFGTGRSAHTFFTPDKGNAKYYADQAAARNRDSQFDVDPDSQPRPRIYRVEPTGTYTRDRDDEVESYKSRQPLRVMGEVHGG